MSVAAREKIPLILPGDKTYAHAWTFWRAFTPIRLGPPRIPMAGCQR
jgi:hypothetical protein